MGTINFVLLAALLALIKTAESLRCWDCTAYEGEPCADYFNATQVRYMNNFDTKTPKQTNCEERQPQYPVPFQKYVCMKKEQTIFGRKQYTRQCTRVSHDQPIGECPRETTNSEITTDFCEFCETDLCNGAPTLYRNVWIAVLPIATLFFIRK